jgi:hypothetical protein
MQHPPASDYLAANMQASLTVVFATRGPMQVTLTAVFATRGPMQGTFQLRWTALEAAWWVVFQEEVGVVTAEIARLMY